MSVRHYVKVLQVNVNKRVYVCERVLTTCDISAACAAYHNGQIPSNVLPGRGSNVRF